MKEWFRFIDPLREKIESLISDRRNLLLICGCAVGCILLLLILVILLGTNHNQEERSQDSQKSPLFTFQTIKPEEFFLPSEPDFLPEVILDRKPKTLWTDEDAKQFWHDPLNGNAEVWKNRIIRAVDELLENIP